MASKFFKSTEEGLRGEANNHYKIVKAKFRQAGFLRSRKREKRRGQKRKSSKFFMLIT